MHSVRAEACDCPPTQFAKSEEESTSTILPGCYESREGSFVSSDRSAHEDASPFLSHKGSGSQKDERNKGEEYSRVSQDKYWSRKQKKQSSSKDAVKKASQVGEKVRCPVQESEKCRRIGNNGFLRVLFWQFHHFRMLLGSDLLVFSNEKYVAVSLHLWDVTRQVHITIP